MKQIEIILKLRPKIKFNDGEYGAFEIKLGLNDINKAIDNLIKFRNNVDRKPKFCCVIVGVIDYAIYDKKEMSI